MPNASRTEWLYFVSSPETGKYLRKKALPAIGTPVTYYGAERYLYHEGKWYEAPGEARCGQEPSHIIQVTHYVHA